eukprot:scaffold17.g441.t1
MASTVSSTLQRPTARLGAARPATGVHSSKAALIATPLKASLRVPSGALRSSRAPVKVEARAAAKGGQVQVDVDKPLGLVLDQSRSPKGGLVVKSASGNAAKAGIQASPGGALALASRSPAARAPPSPRLRPPPPLLPRNRASAPPHATPSAAPACPSPVAIVVIKGENTSVDVKRLPKKPAPARFGRKLTAAQKARATHICLDCGYIYCDETPWERLPKDYVCPQCNAPRRRFARFNVETGKVAAGAGGMDAGTLATVVGGLLGVALLGYLGLSL